MTLPLQSHPFNAGGPVDPVWLAWLRTLEQGTASDNAALASQISAIATALGSPDGTVANIPPLGASQTQVFQGAGIQVDGNAHDGYQISLRMVADSGSGSFLLITKDSFGRVTGTIAGTAADVPYDNTTSGLTADDVQAAIDETVALIPATTDDLPEGSINLYFPEAPEDGSNYARKDGAWVSFASGGDVVGPASSTDGDFALFDGATGKFLKDGGAPGGMAFIDDAPSDGTTYGRKDGAWEAVTGGGGSGTVTSVGLSLPAEFSVTGSPVTTSGTLTAAYANQTTNKVFASPNGSTGTPSFRALVAADIPTIAAANTSIADAGGYFTSTNVEGALQEVGAAVAIGSVAWTLLNSWDFSVSGAVASIEAALSGYNEVLVVASDVTLAASGYRSFQVSSNGGTSWQTSYDFLDHTGVRSTSSLTFTPVHNTTNSASRSGSSQFSLLADAESRVMGNEILATGGSVFQIPALGSKPNRIKVGGWTGAGVATNMTAGKVFIYAR